MNVKIEKVLVKFLMNTANVEDLEVLTDWLKKDEHKQIFKSYVKTNYAMDINMSEFDSEHAKKEYLRKIRKDKNILHKLKSYKILKYAAAAVIVFGLGYFFQKDVFTTSIETTPIIVNTSIEPGTDKATLTLGDGSQVALEKGANFQTQNANSNGEEIIYDRDQNTTEIVFNYVTIPRGGQFFIKLSDGTQVWLNSESQLKYPVSFIDGKTREVELIYGEAYFDVSPSIEHKDSEFRVINNAQEVQVLGTEFNIKAYKDEMNIYTTLVEGKVDVKIDSRTQSLSPNQQLNLNLNTNATTIKKIDVYGEISWKEGVFSFENKSLKEMMKVLSRWYDVDVIIKNKLIEDEEFVGVLRKNQDLEKILTSIKNSGIIENFEIGDKKVVLE